MTTCKIQWIVPEKGDVPTPDTNEAVGYAICFSGEIEAFPICREHLERMPREGWMFVRLADASPEKLAALLAEVNVVVGAIKKAFDEWPKILPTLRASSDFYSFERWGMFVGVEKDGYIHT